jgi:phytoene synthase
MADNLEGAYVLCAENVRKFDPDRHVANHFAPVDRRPHLAALHAFALEIGRVRASAREAAPGEIRLQWWREALSGGRASEAAANPVAAALLATVREDRLPLKPLLDLVDARTFDLYDDLMPDWTTLEGYLGEIQSSIFQLSTMILLKGDDPRLPDAAGHAGVAWGLTALLRAFPWHARRGQVFLPESLLSPVGLSREDIVSGQDDHRLRAALAETRSRAREHLTKACAALSCAMPAVRPAFLPLAMVETYLHPMELPNYKPFGTIIDAAQWLRIWRMWRVRF